MGDDVSDVRVASDRSRVEEVDHSARGVEEVLEDRPGIPGQWDRWLGRTCGAAISLACR